MFDRFVRKASCVVLSACLVTSSSRVRAQTPFGTPNENSAFSIPEAQQIQPAELNKILSAKSGDKPLILQVGSRVLFDQAHIAGSEYAGPGSQPEGIDRLKQRVKSVPKEKAIVLYCGCCPWNRCPNVAPAFRTLQGMGFTNVRVLYVANNLGTDWVDKGYQVARGH
jgi:thiosulfate/3-mercaptopyruvate sulfurtransferase